MLALVDRYEDPRRLSEARLQALGLRGETKQGDAECIHCGRAFDSWTGHVSAEASLCDFCLHRD